MEKDPRWTTICTNGLLIEKKIDTLLPISENMVLLISLDGLNEANDYMRGKKTFERVIHQINLLLDLRKKGLYKGLISINTVLNDSFIPQLYEFMEYFEQLNVDSVYFNYPWYISENQAQSMDNFYLKQLEWMDNTTSCDSENSWHSYKYRISESSTEMLWKQIEKLNSRKWKIRIRFQPPLEKHEIEYFIAGKEKPDMIRRECFAVSNRIDIHADGKVGSCKFFPELSIGDIEEEGLIDIWHSDKFGKFREQISKGLMPVCSKCVLLYLNGK
jgi:radical SAM protein with 4Fe4S-binding SPASM domain